MHEFTLPGPCHVPKEAGSQRILAKRKAVKDQILGTVCTDVRSQLHNGVAVPPPFAIGRCWGRVATESGKEGILAFLAVDGQALSDTPGNLKGRIGGPSRHEQDGVAGSTAKAGVGCKQVVLDDGGQHAQRI